MRSTAPQISLHSVENFPTISIGDDILPPIIAAAESDVQDGDILCVASKIVSLSEGRVVDLQTVVPSREAERIHTIVPRKDPRIIELMIRETGAPDGERLAIEGSWIGGTLPNGLMLTSAGIDKYSGDRAVLLPANADDSARKIGLAVMKAKGLEKLGVIITDSDGREDRRGATQVAVGVFGLPPIRSTEAPNAEGKAAKKSEETLCDFVAAAAGIIMGQRGTGRPLAICRGVEFEYDAKTTMSDALLQKT